jgi:hypothetical protein
MTRRLNLLTLLAGLHQAGAIARIVRIPGTLACPGLAR